MPSTSVGRCELEVLPDAPDLNEVQYLKAQALD